MYIAYIKTQQDSNNLKEDKSLNYDDEHTKHEYIKRKIAEINLAKIKGDVHDADDVKRVMENMLSNFRTRLMGVPSKLAPVLMARDNINLIQDLIEKEIIEVLEELSEYDPMLFIGDDYIDLEEDEDEIPEEN